MIIKMLDSAYDHASDAESSISNAEERINAALNQLETLQAAMASSAIVEALQASMGFMVTKYGHSSKEVMEVEQFIAHGTTP